MERIVFDGRAVIHSAALEPLRERTVVIGSVSKEYRMIGWRVGWVAASARLLERGRVAATPMRDWGDANGASTASAHGCAGR